MEHNERPRVTVILPCLDEARSIVASVDEACSGLRAAGLDGEVLVVDNGSTDNSAALAELAGARVVAEPRPGYGAALRRGIVEATGDVAVMADADLTYDLANLGSLVQRVEQGADVVLANRLDGANVGTMPFLHRVVGTPLLSLIVRRTSGGAVRVRDSQSGYRAFRLDAVRALRLQTDGMEFASEMLIQAGQAHLRIEEIRLPYRERTGDSKLNPVEDGLRHLKLLTLLAPRLALLWPGLALLVLGALLTAASLASPAGLEIGGSRWQPVFFGPIALVMASLLVVSYLIVQRASPLSSPVDGPDHSALRGRLVAVGITLLGGGVAIDGVLFVQWAIGGAPWDRSLALAGLAQALLLSGAIWITSAFLYWLVQRQSEYGANRR